MKLLQATKLAVLTLCASLLIYSAQADPKSGLANQELLQKEQDVTASRLRIGDVIYAVYAPDNQDGKISTVEVSFKAMAKVVSLSPITINLNDSKTSSTAPKGFQKEIGDFAIMTFTGQPSGFVAFVTIIKPNTVKFDRLRK